MVSSFSTCCVSVVEKRIKFFFALDQLQFYNAGCTMLNRSLVAHSHTVVVGGGIAG